MKPPMTGAQHELPFDKLSPRDFERLCFWLVEREGFERALPILKARLGPDHPHACPVRDNLAGLDKAG
jgi:hypothetical protein